MKLMKPLRKGSLVLIGLFLVPFFPAIKGLAKEKPAIRFDHYTIREGLSQSTVNCIMQDHKGLIWIGTQDGLNRFNGYEFTVFQKDPQDSSSISNNFVHSILEGPTGGVLVGTENGLDRFHRKGQGFEAIDFEDELRPTIRALEKDGKGNVWIGTLENGLFVLPQDSGLAYRPKGLSPDIHSVRNLCMGEGDSLWVGTSDKGLFIYQYRKERLIPTPVKNLRIHAVHSTKGGDYWIGTERGAFRLEIEKGAFQVSDRVRAGDKKGALPHPVVKAVHKDRKGRVWFGTAGGGLSRLYLEEGEKRFHHYQHHDYIPSSLANDLVNSIHEDRTHLDRVPKRCEQVRSQRTEFSSHHFPSDE
ncbi:MAG: two-component regulator propeller domain-containing protein [Flavobacteriales bacterium]